jgi:plastocyanin
MEAMTGNKLSVIFTAALLAAAGCGDKTAAPAAPAAGGGAGKAPAAAAAPAAGGGGAYDAAKSKASVKITAKWAGAKPAPVALVFSGDTFCTSAHTSPIMSERFVVNDDTTVPSAFVWAAKGPHEGMTGFPAPAAFTLDQHGCMYVPHVFGVRVGQEFAIKNSDGTTHNVHAKPSMQDGFNHAQATGATNNEKFAKKERAIPFNCDIHSWMSAYGFVLEHPFFGATAADGSVTISGLPAGEYTFKVWHESFTAGVKELAGEVKVTLKDGESVSKEVTLTEVK